MSKILKFYVKEVEQDELDILAEEMAAYNRAEMVIDSFEICQASKNKIVIGVLYRDKWQAYRTML